MNNQKDSQGASSEWFLDSRVDFAVAAIIALERDLCQFLERGKSGGEAHKDPSPIMTMILIVFDVLI